MLILKVNSDALSELWASQIELSKNPKNNLNEKFPESLTLKLLNFGYTEHVQASKIFNKRGDIF